MHRISLLLVITVFLAACGFHMRGSSDLTATNLDSLNLTSGSAADLAREVRSQLQLAGVQMSVNSDYTLSLHSEAYERQVLTVSPVTGKVEEYTMTLAALVMIRKRNENAPLVNEMIRVSRDYLFDEDALLGKAAEEETIREDLRRQAAARIIRRLNATANNN